VKASRRLRVAVLTGVTVLAAAGVTWVLAPAANAAVTGSAYVWANDPTSSSYTPNTLYQYNSTGSWNTVSRQGTGQYTINLPGLGASRGTVLVTAYGSTSNYCKVVRWSPNQFTPTLQQVFVNCFTASGAPADSQYTMSYTNRLGPVHAWVWANDPTATSYTPNTNYQANSTGALNTITRGGVGQYVVHVPVSARDGAFGHAMSTAYGSGAERCSVPQTVGTGPADPEGSLLVDVYCFTPAGAPVDTKFTMTFVRTGNVIGGSVSNGGTDGFPSLYAHVFARNLGETTRSGAEGDSWYVSDGGTLRVDHLGTGVYAVHSTMDSQLGHGTVHVASMAVQTDFYCKVGFWTPGFGIEVLCFATNGSPLDADFYVDFVGGFLIA
jgi:hypothetical protein